MRRKQDQECAQVVRLQELSQINISSDVREKLHVPFACHVHNRQKNDPNLVEEVVGKIAKVGIQLDILQKFLQLVVEGEQDQAKAMLRQTPEIALYSGTVTDLSGRTFNNITGFQYAVWALDSHMWNMISSYLPVEAAREQVQGLETGSWVAQHGKSASWQNLIDALDEFIKLCNESKWDQAAAQWNGAVGNAQQQLPVHVVNQYCHPTRPFSPCPNFNDQIPLPRSRETDEGDWFACECNGGKIGKNCFAFVRGWGRCVGRERGLVGLCEVEVDRTACVTYINHKTQLRDQLLSDLTSTSYCNKPGL